MTDSDRDPSAPLIVVNPRAARLHDARRRADVTDAVVRAVRARTGQDALVVGGDMYEAGQALRAQSAATLVIAVGGDGTIRQAAAILAERRDGNGPSATLAIVPGGTGNVLAGSLRIRGVSSALNAIRHSEPRRLDLGEASWGRPGQIEPAGRSIFVAACGTGLDARIMAIAEHEWKRRMRFGAYVGAALRTIPRLRPADFRIDADGERIEVRGYLALIANAGELVPGRVGPRRRIDPFDGRLDLIVVTGGHPIAGLRASTRLLLARDDMSHGPIRRTVQRVRIDSAPAEPIEVDGDAYPSGWLEARVLGGALDVLTGPKRS